MLTRMNSSRMLPWGVPSHRRTRNKTESPIAVTILSRENRMGLRVTRGEDSYDCFLAPTCIPNYNPT